MAITHITIDFWQTLYDSSNGPERNAARRSVLRAVLETEHGPIDTDAFEAAYKGLWEYFDHHWLGSQRTPTSEEMVREILRRLGVALPKSAVREVAREFEEGILRHPPSLLPDALEGVRFLASRGPLALISDTAFSPGTVLRRLMERDGLGRYFQTFVFSDETGVAKPHPAAFFKALEGIGGTADRSLHIGDIERTDVKGAKGIGMKALLYRSAGHQHKYAEEETEADAIMEAWSEIEVAFERLSQDDLNVRNLR